MNTPKEDEFTSMNFAVGGGQQSQDGLECPSIERSPEEARALWQQQEQQTMRHNRNNSQKIRSQERQYTFNDEAETVIVEPKSANIVMVESSNYSSCNNVSAHQTLSQDLFIQHPDFYAAAQQPISKPYEKPTFSSKMRQN